MNVLGERIKQRREELGMTQTELAERMGYKSRSSINKIENGTNDIVQSKVERFAKVLDTGIGFLMGWDDKPVVRVTGIKAVKDEPDAYYINADAREYAEFLHKNPEYRVLFDSYKKVKPEDIDLVRQLIDKMSE